MKPNRLHFLCVTFLSCAAGWVGCGQLTGLSDDYTFDLTPAVEGGSDARTDSPVDASPDGDGSDGAAACSTAQVTVAAGRLSSFSGTPTCKACIAESCCNDVSACLGASDCKRYFTCQLACTTQAAGERAKCFNNCGGGAPPALYTSGIGTCTTTGCPTACGFP
jgi:hypothetical protein